jgi:cytochrome b
MAAKPPAAGIRLPMPIWDLPTRLFHWVLVGLVAFSYFSAKYNKMDLHVLSGHAVLALLIFRVVWGFVGSDTARFSRFLKSPLAALRHLSHFLRREPDTQVGHNEAGGWMVIGLLLLLAAQVATGLCANDDGTTEGPLVKYISKALSDRLSGFHSLIINILLVAIAGHVLAVIGYAVFKGHDLVRPMITGRKRLPAATPAPGMIHPVVALVVLLVAAAIAFVVGRLI